MSERSFFAELKRRNVLRAAALYAAGAWLLVQVVTQVGPVFDLPSQTQRWIIVAAVIGFPFAMVLSWFYELTPEGFKRDDDVAEDASIRLSSARKLDFAIITVLSIAVVLLLANTFVARKDAGASVAAVPGKSIAVLPFVDLSPAHDQEYFSDGMSEEILNALAQVKDLKVAGRTSSFHFKGRNDDLRSIGKALGVANILEGSVRKQGDKVRITAQLIQVSDDTHLWSHDYDGDLSDVFALQDNIARAITDQLKVVLVGGQKTQLAPKTTANAHAHQDYLRGQFFWHQRGYANLENAIASYKTAIAADPDYADAWAALAQAYAVLPEYAETDATSMSRPDTTAMALDAAEHALRLDPDSSPALLARAYIRGARQFDWSGSEADFRAVLKRHPNDATAHQWYSEILNYQCRWPEVDAQLAQTLALDPLSPIAQHIKGWSLILRDKPAQALPYFEEALRIAPRLSFAMQWKVIVLAQQGHYDEASSTARELPDPLRVTAMDFIAGMRDKLHRDEAAQALLARTPTLTANPIMLAILGRNDLAMAAVEKMFQAHAAFRGTLYCAAQLAPLHDNPRFMELMRQVNLPPAATPVASP